MTRGNKIEGGTSHHELVCEDIMTELRSAENFLITWLGKNKKPMSVSEILAKRRYLGVRISPFAFRGSVWNLVDCGKIEFTPERKLQLARVTLLKK